MKTAPWRLLFTLGVILLTVAAGAQEKANNNESSDATQAGKKLPAPGELTALHTAAGDPVYIVGKSVSAPRVLKSPDPVYTIDARNAKIQGTVILVTIVNLKGVAEQIRVQRSLDPGLDESAVQAVRLWKFAPATKDGQPVAVMINVQVNFRLR